MADLVVGQPRPAHGQAQLVECQVLADADGERERHDLQEEGAVIPRRHFVEPVAVVGDDPGEDVDAPGRALRVGLPAQPGRQIEALLELDQVRTPGLEHRSVAPQVDLVEDVVLQLALDRVGPGQEAAPDAECPLAQAQVEARRLDVGVGDVEAAGVDVTGPDRPLEQLAREHALGRRLEAQHRGRRRAAGVVRACTDRAKHVAGPPGKAGTPGVGHSLWTTWGQRDSTRGFHRNGRVVHRAARRAGRGPRSPQAPRPATTCVIHRGERGSARRFRHGGKGE